MTCYAVENGWAKIDYNGTKAYVKADYLQDATTDASASADNDSDETSSDESGKEITLSNTVNVRESMSETASKVAVAYAGESLTVIRDFAEGWSKVNYNGKEGYCKTEFLK